MKIEVARRFSTYGPAHDHCDSQHLPMPGGASSVRVEAWTNCFQGAGAELPLTRAPRRRFFRPLAHENPALRFGTGTGASLA
jgi:hypothetical protein